jgi:SNF2 family DNA or RNA helicase
MGAKILLKEIDPSTVSVEFAFDWKIIRALRLIKSRRFNEKTKENYIAKEDINKLKEMLPGFQFVDRGSAIREYKITIHSHTFSINPELPFTTSKISRLMYLRRPRDGYRLYDLLVGEGYNVTLEDNVKTIPIHMPTEPSLYEFQNECMNFLRDNDYNGLVSLDMGLGKTLVALQSIKELSRGPVLIVAPSSLLYQWQGEIQKHFNHDAEVITSKVKPDDREEQFNRAEIAITNYELLKTVKVDRQYEMLILDECQKIKNWKTGNSKAIAGIASRRVIGLSGTPIENNLLELYNITDQIIPAYFGTAKVFAEQHVNKDRWGNIRGYKNLENVYHSLNNIMYRKTKDQVEVQLPNIVCSNIHVILNDDEYKAYWDMMKEQKNILGAITNAKVFASSSGLRMDIEKSSKEAELLRILKEQFSNKKVIIFTQYKNEVDRLVDLIPRELYAISGKDSKLVRGNMINNFLETDNGILLMTEVGTHGLNLQEVDTIINMDLPWTYARLTQRIGRIQRIGSKHESNLVLNLVSHDTIDKRVLEVIDKKKELFEISVDGAKKYIANRFSEDLQERGIVFEEVEDGLSSL